MDPRTEAHLTTAEAHRQFARALLTPRASTLLQPLPLGWAVVVAFYAAVHYVNALLWERQRYEPRTHQDRVAAVTRTRELRSTSVAYTELQDLAYRFRYAAGFRPQRATVETAVYTHLEHIRQIVRQAFGATP